MSKRLKKEILKHALFSGVLLGLLSIYVPSIIDMDFWMIDENCMSEAIENKIANFKQCLMGPSWGFFLHIFLCLFFPFISVLLYRKKTSHLVYRECFSICFLTIAIGTLMTQLVFGYNLALEYEFTYQYLLALQAAVMTFPIWAAYSFLLAHFLKK